MLSFTFKTHFSELRTMQIMVLPPKFQYALCGIISALLCQIINETFCVSNFLDIMQEWLYWIRLGSTLVLTFIFNHFFLSYQCVVSDKHIDFIHLLSTCICPFAVHGSPLLLELHSSRLFVWCKFCRLVWFRTPQWVTNL